jgi:hypothetical protein
MRLLSVALLSVLLFSGCRDANDPRFILSFDEILTKQSWQMQRYTTPTGRAIPDNELSEPTAIAIKSMYFVFEESGIVTAYDKASKTQILGGRGAWSVNEDKSRIQFDLVGNTLEFRVIRMENERMIWEAETGSFLTGVGQSINLEFAPRL